MIGIYIHVPFCASFCLYCNFYSVKRLAQRASYREALGREIARRSPSFLNSIPQERREKGYTLYLGGGTPSVLGAEAISGIIEDVKRAFCTEYFKELTVEVNPDDVTPAFAASLKASGATRISMGVQSLHNSHLKWMGRRHTAEEAIGAYKTLREAGFGNISLDLIFGYAGLSDERWRSNLQSFIALSPEHISGYQMSIEPSTPLGKAVERGEYEMPSQEECRTQYTIMQEMLSEAGYRQYEISNFARPGFEALHNSNYWNGTPYIGFGPGAHSYSGHPYDSRFWNSHNLTAYLRGDDILKSEYLSATDLFNETIMLGLRTTSGVDTSQLDPKLYGSISREVERFIRNGKLEMCGSRLRINPTELFISDSIIRELFVV